MNNNWVVGTVVTICWSYRKHGCKKFPSVCSRASQRNLNLSLSVRTPLIPTYCQTRNPIYMYCIYICYCLCYAKFNKGTKDCMLLLILINNITWKLYFFWRTTIGKAINQYYVLTRITEILLFSLSFLEPQLKASYMQSVHKDALLGSQWNCSLIVIVYLR
jgi:hypothetical protein